MKSIFRILIICGPVALIAFISGDINSDYKIPRAAVGICSNDLEIDGDNDLIAGHITNWGYANISMTILKNNGNGYFLISDTTKSFPGNHEYISTARINNDSFPDIITQSMNVDSGNTERFIRVFFNNGSGGFNDYTDFSLNSGNVVSGITVGDINGDQSEDVLIVVNLQRYWGVLYNDGLGNLSIPEYHNLNNYSTDIAAGDLNADDRDDVVIASVPIYIFYSHPWGFRLDSLSGDATLVKINDMNNDGKPDIIGRRLLFGTEMVIYENLGNENYILHTIDGFSFYADQFIISDMNNDSLPDIIITTDSYDGLYILYNLGNFVFSNPVFISIPNIGGENGRRICINDFDGNGFNDIALVKVKGGNGTPYPNLILLFNDGQGNFVPDPITFSHEKKISKLCFKNFPNPFHSETTFEFSVGNASSVELIIFDVNGETIFESLNNDVNSGIRKIRWDGHDNAGKICLPGVYVASLVSDKEILVSKKIIIN
jgi:hypothetical protein